MDQFVCDESTLPIDFNGSSNPDQLDEVTLGTQLEYPDGVNIQMVTKTGSGRMSPVRARTMKDYEQQIGELKKENFGLKLRIYFLEERVQAKFTGDGEELFKTNIELKVEVESLKKELIDKQELLKKASNALESISTQHQTDLQLARDQACEEVATQAGRDAEKTQQEMDRLSKQVEERDAELTQYKKQLEDANRRVAEFREINTSLDAAYKQLECKKRQLETPKSALPVGRYTSQPDGGDQDEMDGGASNGRSMMVEELEDKQRVIDQLKNALKTKELILEQTEEEKKDVAKTTRLPLENRIKQLERRLEVKDREVQTLVQKLSQALEGTKPGEIINTLILNEELERKTREMERMTKVHEENALKRDKAIQGLTSALLCKDNELQESNRQFEQKTEELNKAKDTLHQANLHKYQSLEEQQHALSTREEKIAELEAELRERQLENERLKKNIDRKQGEIARLTEQLDKSDEVLRERENSMQSLLDEVQRKLESKETACQRLQRSARDAERRVQEYEERISQQQPQNESREGMLKSLKQQLLDKDYEIENVLEEKFKGFEEKDAEIRQLKMALKERDHDIERANQMLLATEQTIDTLDKETQEKDITLQELGEKVKASQQQLQVCKDEHDKTLIEKEAQIENLSKTLQQKQNQIKDLSSKKSAASEETQQLLNSLRTPAQLAQTEDLLALQEALQAEREVYHNLNQMARLKPGEQRKVLEVELEAIAALRRHLENCVNKVRPSQLRGKNIPDLESRLRQLESELRASQRANQQLQSQLAQYAKQTQSHDQGDGASSGHMTNKSTAPANSQSDSMHLSSSFLPSFAHLPGVEEIVPSEDALREMTSDDLQEVIGHLREELCHSHAVNSDLQRQLDFMPKMGKSVKSGRQESEYEDKPDNGRVGLSGPQTEQVIQRLQESDSDRKKLQRQLDMIMFGPTSDKDIRIIPVLREELQELRENLGQKQEELENLQSALKRTEAKKDEELMDERARDSEDFNASQAELQHLKDQVHRLENINMLLKRQIELNSMSGNDGAEPMFNPELICQMAGEIERLKAELKTKGAEVEKARRVEGEESVGMIGRSSKNGNDSSQSSAGSMKTNGKSCIPILKNKDGHSTSVPVQNSQLVLQKQIECMRADLADSQDFCDLEVSAIENQNLQDKLASTEATVRSMSEKLRGYRSQLEENGIQPRTPSPSRQNSESNLRLRNRSPSPQIVGPRGRQALVYSDNERRSPTGGEELSPDTWYSGGPSISVGVDSSYFQSFGQTTNAGELKSQISELKGLLLQARSEVDDLKAKLRLVEGKNLSRLSRSGQFREDLVGDSNEEEYRRMAGVISPPPDLTPFSKTKAANQEVFNKLTSEVQQLKKKLHEVEEMNSTLRSQMDNSSMEVASSAREDMEEMLQSLQYDNSQLRQQLAESQGLCATLRVRLQDLSDFLEEFFVEDEQGQVDLGRITPASIAELKEKLNDTQNMTSNLSVSLRAPDGESLLSTQRSFEVRQIGLTPPDDGEGPGQVDIELKYNEAREQIQQLELQLGRRGGEPVPNLEELKQLKGENKSLKEEINELNKLLTEKDIVTKSLKQEKSLGKERNAHLQQEINRLRQEWLSLKEGLSSEQQNVVRFIDQIDAQQRELEKYKKDACDLKEILIEEQEKFRFCDHEKQLLAKEVEKSRSDSGRMSFDKTALEEKNIALQEELARLKEECNQMTVEKSKHKALLEELKADRDRQKDGLMSRDDLNVQLKELLHDNQDAAEKLREELQRLNGELEDKNNNISRLKSKLSRVQRKYQIPSSDLTSEPGDIDHLESSLTRPRAGSSGIESVSATFGNGGNSHKAEFHTVLGENGDKSSGRNSRASPTQEISPSPARSRSSTERSLRSRENSPLRSPYSSRGDDSTFVEGRSDKEEKYQKEIYLLRGQLSASKNLNDALKKELGLYDTMSRNSPGIHNSHKMGSLSTQVGGGNSGTGELSLWEHLEEIRALRLRLEESIQQNNKLRELLEKQLANVGFDHNAVEEYLSKPRSVSFSSLPPGGPSSEVQQNLDEMTKELELLQQEVHAKNREIDGLTRELQEVRRDMMKKDKIFLELEDRLKTKDHTLQMLTMDGETKTNQLRSARQELKRLKDEINVRKADAEEQAELNKTLRLELNVYDKMNHSMNDSQNGGTTVTSQGLDLNLLLQEIRQLRIQLEKSIDNNNLLRQKLEEQLNRGLSPRSPAQSLTFYEKEGSFSRDGSPDPDRMMATLSGLHGDDLKRKKTSAGRSPASSRSRTPVPSSPPTKLDRSLSADRERYTSPRSSRPNSRGPAEDSLHQNELTNGNSALPSPEFARAGYSMEDPLHSTFGSSYRMASPDAVKVNGFVPGSSDGAMRYSILDPARPPKRSPSSVENDLDYLQEVHGIKLQIGSTTVRVGSDLRQLYAIGELDDYELLKKEISESHSILNGMECRIRDRMRSYSQRSQGESKEFQILRDIISSIHQCKTLNSEASRLVALFWMSQLPLRDEHGNFVDVKMLKQNQGLQDELMKYKRECSRLKVQLRDTNSHMEITSRSRDGMEQELLRQLNSHHTTLRKTTNNLEKFNTGVPLSYR